MSKNSKSLAMAATLTGLLTVGPALIAQSTSGSSGGGSMDSHPGAMQSTSTSMSKTTTMTKMSSADSAFAKKAAMGGMEEVALGQLAAQKGTDPDVKSFGQRMVDDHSKANDQLKQLAAQKGITLPTAVSSMQKTDMDKLNGLSGAAFDKAYVDMMVKDHKKDIAEFQKEAKSGKDADLKSFASTTLPTLEEHLKMIQDIHAKMSKGMSSSKSGMGH